MNDEVIKITEELIATLQKRLTDASPENVLLVNGLMLAKIIAQIMDNIDEEKSLTMLTRYSFMVQILRGVMKRRSETPRDQREKI